MVKILNKNSRSMLKKSRPNEIQSTITHNYFKFTSLLLAGLLTINRCCQFNGKIYTELLLAKCGQALQFIKEIDCVYLAMCEPELYE